VLNADRGRPASTPAAMVATPDSAGSPNPDGSTGPTGSIGPTGSPRPAVSPSPASSDPVIPLRSAAGSGTAAGITAISLCGFAANGTGEVGLRRTAPEPLPAGFVWHRDTLGFALALPAGWNRSKLGPKTCFRDPAGGRALTVDSRKPDGQQPLEYWQAAEKAAAKTVPGYSKVSMDSLLLKDGGADWEYTWQPAAGPRLHTRRVLLAVGTDREFLLQWTTSDQDWTLNVPTQQRIVSSLREF
jgi:hypothetical protein